MSKKDYALYLGVKQIIKRLRGEILRAGELLLAEDLYKFGLLRSHILNLFGETRGVERQLKDLFQAHQSQNGQAGYPKSCGKENVHEG